jgi:single-strand DNA-binding protein
MLIGNLANDPEIRQTKDGREVATFALATNRTIKENGERKELADFHRVVVFNGLAKIAKEYLSKGVAVYVDGRLINRSFDDKNGVRHYRTEVIGDKLNILTWRKTKEGKQIEIENLGKEDVAELEEEAVAA